MESIGSAAIPAFLLKLRGLLDDDKTSDLISWDEAGESFHLFNQVKFAKEVLPKFFKHNNLASFVRQLNMYGFKKITSLDQGGLQGANDAMEFLNKDFVRDAPQKMINIRRKGTAIKDKLKESTALEPAYIQEVVSDVKDIKESQNSISGQLDIIKRENSVLWREIASLRQKHVQQQQVINKLIHFLMSMAGTGRRNRMKRTIPLMIEDTASLKRPRVYTGPATAFTPPSQNDQLYRTDDGISIKDITEELSTKPTVESPSEGVNLELPKISDTNELGITPDSLNDYQFLTAQPTQLVAQPSTSNALVRSTSMDDPMCDHLGENIGELQSHIEGLKDLFTNGIGLNDDALNELFNADSEKVPQSPINIPADQLLDLDDLLANSLSDVDKERFVNYVSHNPPADLLTSGDQAIEAPPLTDQDLEVLLASSEQRDNETDDHATSRTSVISTQELD